MPRLERLRDQLKNVPKISENSPHYSPVDLTGSPDPEPVDVYVKDIADDELARKDIKAARLRAERRAVIGE